MLLLPEHSRSGPLRELASFDNDNISKTPSEMVMAPQYMFRRSTIVTAIVILVQMSYTPFYHKMTLVCVLDLCKNTELKK